MTATDELRAQLRKRKPAAPPAWLPPTILSFRGFTEILAWDATLSHAGWVVAERTEAEVVVRDKGTIHIASDLTGYLSTWQKAQQLRHCIGAVMAAYPDARNVVEAPAVKGSRLESSLIAGLLIWLETEGPTGLGCPQVSATHVSAVLCGNSRLKSADRKKAVKEACARYVPASATRAWDEHQRDALAVALTHLHDLRRRDGNFTIPNFI